MLKSLGFTLRTTKGSHEQWVKDENGKRFKVTVDNHHSPFGPFLVDSMVKQAGVTKKQFYALID